MCFFVRSFFLLTKNHFTKPYDIIHVHSIPDFLIFTTLIAKLKGAKIILDMHDLIPEYYASKFKSNQKSLVYKLLLFQEKISADFADQVIISNHLWQKKIVKRAVKEEKCMTILNYPDPEIFHKRFKKKSNGKFIIIYPGSVNWHQGIDIAVKAFALIENEVPEAEFHIYGDGDDRQTIEKLIAELGMGEKIFFKNELSLNEIAEVLANSDLGVVPKRKDSFGNEAFSTKILEFMASGVPVVVSDTKIDKFYFNDSIVKYFQSGNEKDLAESILTLIKNQTLRENLVFNAYDFINKNNWYVKKKEYFALVDSLVQNRKRRITQTIGQGKT